MQRTDLSKRHCSVRIPSKFVRSQFRPIMKKGSITSWSKRLLLCIEKEDDSFEFVHVKCVMQTEVSLWFRVDKHKFFLEDTSRSDLFHCMNSCILRHLDEDQFHSPNENKFLIFKGWGMYHHELLMNLIKLQSSSIFNAKSRLYRDKK